MGASSARTTGPVTSWRPSAALSSVERYGRFEILGRIGRGGMAEILLARERSPAGGSRHLVIKRVLPEAKDSDEMRSLFLDEARVVMGLFHPNLCQVYEVGEQDGSWFIAMEWVNGTTLHQLLRRAVSEGDIDHAILARVVSLCAEALHHAHTARDGQGRLLHLVHRDVSPHNIMVGYDGRVKLLDFGIAKSTESTHQTEAGVVKGKVCYMSPEQWLCAPLDARTDVFALGACLYEALTGIVVFKRETQSEVMRAVLQEGAPPLSEVAPYVPAQLAAVAHRALAFDPQERFQSAQEMSDALEDYIASLSAPLPASKVAGYVRRLFRSEVELGPLLERTVRGAHLPAHDVVLPPLPPALLGLPKITPSMFGLPENDVASSRPAVAPRFDLVQPTLTVRDADIAPAALLSMEDLTQSAERPVAEPPASVPVAPVASVSGVNSADAEARPLARTVSIHAGRRIRKAALLGMPALAALVLAFVSLREAPRQTRDVRVASAALSAKQPPVLELEASALPPEAPLPAETVEQPSRGPLTPRDARQGRLSINTRPWSTVSLGTRVLGTTPLADVSVPRGALVLKLVDRDGKTHVRRLAPSRKPERTAFYDLEAPKKRAKRTK